MLEFEQYAITELGLSEDMLAENAARGIAQTAIRCLREESSVNSTAITPTAVSSSKGAIVSNGNRTSNNVSSSLLLKSPLVVMAGNHRSGARALAAARHLHCHGFKVSATLMGAGGGGSEQHEEDLLDSVRQQLHAFRKSGGIVVKPAALLESLKKVGSSSAGGSASAGAGAAGPQPPPGLLVDSLLGIHTSFDDLRGEDQAWYFELAILVNRMEWKVLSVDVPSGLDATTGMKSVSSPLYLSLQLTVYPKKKAK
jgi:enhancer of mRNA-decapping protein 3